MFERLFGKGDAIPELERRIDILSDTVNGFKLIYSEMVEIRGELADIKRLLVTMKTKPKAKKDA